MNGSLVFRTPEVDSLGGRSPFDKMRRHALWELAYSKRLIEETDYPIKEKLIELLESTPEKEVVSWERAKEMRTFSLKKLCKDHGIVCDKTSTREYMLGEYEKVLEAA